MFFFLSCAFFSWVSCFYLFFVWFFLYSSPIGRKCSAVNIVLEIAYMDYFPPFCVFFLLPSSLICKRVLPFKYLILVLLFFLLILEDKVINLLFLLPFYASCFIYSGCKISSLCYTINFVFQCDNFVC